mmetsp:Transcript_29825/g.41234  ORF Transcript_29825/g.41234 Transcript_29825/m.41234 type:complete len:652 (+) Transcript_29825:136-2091(+)
MAMHLSSFVSKVNGLTSSSAFPPVGAKTPRSKGHIIKTCNRSRVLAVLTPDAPQSKFEKAVTDEHTKMFCYQCEQTTDTVGCTTVGVCGKTPETAALQDLLVHALKGLGSWAHHARTAIDYEDSNIDYFINEAMFSTLTNVNFDESRFPDFLIQCHTYQEQLKAKLQEAGVSIESSSNHWGIVPDPVAWNIMEAVNNDASVTGLMEFGSKVGIVSRFEGSLQSPTVLGLAELVVYGLKGLCAYLHHAEVLGHRNDQCSAGVAKVLHFLTTPQSFDPEALLAMCMEVGELNVQVLQLLDTAHNERFGCPSPHSVSRVPVEGKCLLVSGHDLQDLESVLELTQDTGVNVYTHGEMLPAHSYPGLVKYPHLKGHYGGAWYQQKSDFARFPGAILMTSNCILEPLSVYRNNIFTTGAVGVGGVKHVKAGAFAPVVAAALELPGFPEQVFVDFSSASPGLEQLDSVNPLSPLTVGFGHQTVLGVSDQIIQAVNEGQLKHIFLIGGCDGSEPSRKYYSNMAKILPQDTITLTLGCAKFRLLGQDWGNLPGTDIPRLLDMGQCNDSYSAVVVAQALAKAFDTDVNGLPLSLDISWFEQKAVAVLLSLLHLGVRNIRLGPRMPAFLTPEATAILVEKFNIHPADIGSPEGDLNLMMTEV